MLIIIPHKYLSNHSHDTGSWGYLGEGHVGSLFQISDWLNFLDQIRHMSTNVPFSVAALKVRSSCNLYFS